MKKNASVLSIAYFTFLMLIISSGFLKGAFSEGMYFLAYAIPFFAVIFFTDRDLPKAREFSLPRSSGRLFLPTVFPTVFVISLLSLLTSLIVSAFSGKTFVTELGNDLLFALFYHALIPSILEELLFRYLPMRYLASDSPRYAVLFSAFFFAISHHSFFSMPYAFFAGAVFMTVNLLCESCLPSIILHFVNNSISVVWSMCFAERTPVGVLFAVLSVPTLVSAFVIYKLRRRYIDRLSVIFSEKSRIYVIPSMIFTALVSIIVATIELFV